MPQVFFSSCGRCRCKHSVPRTFALLRYQYSHRSATSLSTQPAISKKNLHTHCQVKKKRNFFHLRLPLVKTPEFRLVELFSHSHSFISVFFFVLNSLWPVPSKKAVRNSWRLYFPRGKVREILEVKLNYWRNSHEYVHCATKNILSLALRVWSLALRKRGLPLTMRPCLVTQKMDQKGYNAGESI